MALVPSGDQVPRLQAFIAAHPYITIVPPGPGHLMWVATRNGEAMVARFHLKNFLDHLDGLVSS